MVLKSILPHRRPRIANAPGVRFDRPGGTCLQLKCCHCAPVAQMDRAFASGAKGRRFESARAYHINHRKHKRYATRPEAPKPKFVSTCIQFKKSSETAGILGDMDAEEDRHFRTFARN